jgi:voltage-gated potassium channel Kch
MTQAAGESQTHNHQQQGDGARHVIICGFGLSGRSCANVLLAKGISICVIEKNAETVDRCQKGGLQIIEGDASDAEVLRAAGIERATEVAVTIPQDDYTLSVVEAIRALNPNVHIIARCTFVSGGMEAHRRGANEVVVAEQIVANEFGRVMRDLLPR